MNSTLDARGIFALFETAITHSLKYPRIRLQTADGQPVVLKLAGARSKYTGCVQITDDRPFGENTYFGRIDAAGTFYATSAVTPAVRALLIRLAADPAEVASEYGKLTGNCCFCNTPLSDARSTAVGYGPICADHYGLPWGSDFRAPRVREREVIESAFETPAPVSEVDSLLIDPTTPFWAKDVIRVALDKDAIDAANTLEVLAKAFSERARQILQTEAL